MRRRRKKFNANALPFFRKVAEKNHAAFLLFFRHRVDQNDIRAHFHFGLNVKQRAMSVYYDGLAILTEFTAHSRLPSSTHRNAREDAGTAPSGRTGRCGIHEPILRLHPLKVNSTFLKQCPKCLNSQWRRVFRPSRFSAPLFSLEARSRPPAALTRPRSQTKMRAACPIPSP
jgi:hypothetical protein